MVPHVLHLFSESVLRLNEQFQSITGIDFGTVQSKTKEKNMQKSKIEKQKIRRQTAKSILIYTDKEQHQSH